jgi:hypothetical protein
MNRQEKRRLNTGVFLKSAVKNKRQILEYIAPRSSAGGWQKNSPLFPGFYGKTDSCDVFLSVRKH